MKVQKLKKVGIISYASYVPFWRLSRNIIEPNLKREKPVATYDENSIAMTVGADAECLSGFERSLVDAVYFASTTSIQGEAGRSYGSHGIRFV